MKNKIIGFVGILALALMISISSCTPVSNCSDGIQNGTETGIDCGGQDCPPCSNTQSCTDGIMNGSETGIDCGGATCPACTTCTDGIMNGSETGIDCGGPDCQACGVAPTCTDGIMNGNETGIDCGGPDCSACVTCTDGIQNGSETGVDCGGPDCPACFPFIFKFFENGSLWSAQETFLAVTSDYEVSSRTMDVFKSVGGNAAARFTIVLGNNPTVGSVYTITTSSSSPPASEAGVQYRPTGIISSNVYFPINNNVGTVTITEYNTTTEAIGGAFSTSLTNGTDTLVITNGEFTLPFQD